MPVKKTKATSKANATTPQIPNIIYAQASPHSLGGVSLFDVQDQVQAATAWNFFSEPSLVQRSCPRVACANPSAPT